MDEGYDISIFAPMTGQLLELDKVPDKVFADRMLGDGVAIVPEDGAMFSPVSGYISAIAKGQHAFGFTSDDGIEVLVHFALGGKNISDFCVVHKNINDRVQAGDMVAEFNLEKVQELGINIITPVIICGGFEGKLIRPATGHVQAGAGAVITVVDVEKGQNAAAPAETASGDAEYGTGTGAGERAAAGTEAGEPSAFLHESETMAFLRNRKNWPMLLGGVAGLTVLLVVVFVIAAMMIGR